MNVYIAAKYQDHEHRFEVMIRDDKDQLTDFATFQFTGKVLLVKWVESKIPFTAEDMHQQMLDLIQLEEHATGKQSKDQVVAYAEVVNESDDAEVVLGYESWIIVESATEDERHFTVYELLFGHTWLVHCVEDMIMDAYAYWLVHLPYRAFTRDDVVDWALALTEIV